MLQKITDCFSIDPKDVISFVMTKVDGSYKITCVVKNREHGIIFYSNTNVKQTLDALERVTNLVNKLNNLEKL